MVDPVNGHHKGEMHEARNHSRSRRRQEIADLIEVYLKNEGYAVRKFYAAGPLACCETEVVSLAILDVMLPDMDGFTLCQKFGENHLFPIIMGHRQG